MPLVSALVIFLYFFFVYLVVYSPQTKSKRSFSPPTRVASAMLSSSTTTNNINNNTAANTAINAGNLDRRAQLSGAGAGAGRTHGVTTVQPGMEDEGMLIDLVCNLILGSVCSASVMAMLTFL